MVLVFTSQTLSAHGKGASNIFIRVWRIIFKDEAVTHSGTTVLPTPTRIHRFIKNECHSLMS
jgi:hypothetical protein